MQTEAPATAYFPAVQDVHDTEPIPAENSPAAHEAHAVPDAVVTDAYWPKAHRLQLDAPVRIEDDAHNEQRVAPDDDEYWPAAQLVHNARPVLLPKVPAAHMVQLKAPLGEYFPALHVAHTEPTA